MIVCELQENIERELSSYEFGDENKVGQILKAIGMGYGPQVLMETTGRGYLEELEDWTR